MITTGFQQHTHSLPTTLPAADLFFRQDIHETEKNALRQLLLRHPGREVSLGNFEIRPKLFIAAENFCSAPQCACVNVLVHKPPRSPVHRLRYAKIKVNARGEIFFAAIASVGN